MADKIEVVFSPVGPSSNESGGTLFYHMTLVYTPASGASQYISAGPTTSNGTLNMSTVEQLKQMNLAAGQTLTNTPSVWGTLHVGGSGTFTPGNQTAGIDVVPLKDPNTGQTNPDAGTPFQKATVSTNATLTQWNTIVATYNSVASLHLTYSPYTSNSNSVACTALVAAGLTVPSTSLLVNTPACSVKLPKTSAELQNYLNSLQPAANPWYSLSSTGGSDGSTTTTIDYLNSSFYDFRTTTKTGTVTVREVKNLTEHEMSVFDSVSIAGSDIDIDLMAGGLDVDISGNNNLIDSDFTGFDINAIGNYNVATLDYSTIDFYGTGNSGYGYGSSGTGWDPNEYYGYTGAASASDSPSASRGSEKLVEAMATFDDSGTDTVVVNKKTTTDWAVITAPA